MVHGVQHRHMTVRNFPLHHNITQLCVSAAMPSFLSHFLCYRSNVSIIDATSPLNYIARLLWAHVSCLMPYALACLCKWVTTKATLRFRGYCNECGVQCLSEAIVLVNRPLYNINPHSDYSCLSKLSWFLWHCNCLDECCTKQCSE